jgi:hypothetical protein
MACHNFKIVPLFNMDSLRQFSCDIVVKLLHYVICITCKTLHKFSILQVCLRFLHNVRGIVCTSVIKLVLGQSTLFDLVRLICFTI